MKKTAVVQVLIALVAALAMAAPAAAQSVEEAQGKLSEAEAKVDAIQAELDPIEARLHAAEQEAERETDELKKLADVGGPYHEEVEELTAEIKQSRQDAAAEIESAEQAYADDQDSHDRNVLIGLIVLGIGLIGGIAFFAATRFSSWQPQRWLTIAASAAAAILALVGLVLIVTAPSAEEPTFSEELVAEAEMADESPQDDPTPELAAALEKERPYKQKAARLGAIIEEKIAAAEDIADEAGAIESRRGDAQEDVKFLTGRLEAAEAEVAKEESFKAEAVTIDYKQLIKNPSRYIGEPVVYTGQIFQIQEGYGENFMLLSVTDEGYGFWTDEVWVDGAHTNAAEEDIITVYGTVTGAESYETQIGGSNFVPRIKAKYIEE